MKTEATKDFPEIEWQRGELAERHDHLNVFAAYGESSDGKEWIASWEEVDGQFSDITNIEEA